MTDPRNMETKQAGETAGAGEAAAGHGAKGFNGLRNKTRHGLAHRHTEAEGLWSLSGETAGLTGMRRKPQSGFRSKRNETPQAVREAAE